MIICYSHFLLLLLWGDDYFMKWGETAMQGTPNVPLPDKPEYLPGNFSQLGGWASQLPKPVLYLFYPYFLHAYLISAVFEFIFWSSLPPRQIGRPRQISALFFQPSPALRTVAPLCGPCESNKCLPCDFSALQKMPPNLGEERLAGQPPSLRPLLPPSPLLLPLPVLHSCIKETWSPVLCTPGRSWCPRRGVLIQTRICKLGLKFLFF